MYVDESISHGKYRRFLLRQSFRENGKVKHRTIANLSHCDPSERAAIRIALKHKHNLAALGSLTENVTLKQGASIGATWLIYDLAKQLGITAALGSSRTGKLALWQVIARVIDQGSRLSAVRLADTHAACDILGLESFDEDDLYENLDWLDEKQGLIEKRLFKKMHPEQPPELYLYDVTSSYFEGECNELSAFGYNRDGKKGKRQIVIGLLCNERGEPLSIEVFRGNMQDPKTVASQIRKVASRFGGESVTFVGDRGMIKSKQMADLADAGFHYITAITNAQVKTLLKEGVIQLGLFDNDLAEVKTDDGVRYILRRNPIREKEVRGSREDRFQTVIKLCEKQDEYLETHPRASVAVALRKVNERVKSFKLAGWVSAVTEGRKIRLCRDEDALLEIAKLDGCYVLKTDVETSVASKETVHSRYKDLSQVEWAFRTSKTTALELRPVHVRLASRTRGHVFVVMLAYRIMQELANRWRDFELTVSEGIRELGQLCATEIVVAGHGSCQKVPEPRELLGELLTAAGVELPEVLPCSGIRVATRRSLRVRRAKS